MINIWIIYAFIAAILIAVRDIFTKKFTTKYSPIEHLLYYYILCGFFIILISVYKKYVKHEKIRMIEKNDLWKYAIIAFLGALIISPCQILAIRNCDNPGKSASVVNLNAIISFFLAIYIIKGTTITYSAIIGIIFIFIGVYLIIT